MECWVSSTQQQKADYLLRPTAKWFNDRRGDPGWVLHRCQSPEEAFHLAAVVHSPLTCGPEGPQAGDGERIACEPLDTSAAVKQYSSHSPRTLPSSETGVGARRTGAGDTP